VSGPGIGVSGGGSVAVDTPGIQTAAARLHALGSALAVVTARLAACFTDPALAATGRPAVRAALERADDEARLLARDIDEAAAGLRTAAVRYGETELAIASAQRIAWAGGAALAGAVTRLAITVLGPGVVLLPLTAAGLLAGGATLTTVLRELLTTGRIDPQTDPLVLGGLRLALSSLDDAVHGFELDETPAELLNDDPAGPDGVERTAAAVAGRLPDGGHNLALTATTLPGTLPGPGTLEELGERTPSVEPGGAQLRLDRYPMPDGRSRWIVYVCGTITFTPAATDEPFDLRSDLTGVAGERSDSEAALSAAMRRAGVGPDDPVLLVGHSQGALDAVRLAQRGDFDVQGVVTLGGPTGQLVLPQHVPELSVEHEEDVVPVLGGLPASGSGGLHRLVVRRSLYGGGPPPGPPLVPFAAGAAPHALTEYRETLAGADASPDPRLVAFRARMRPFLDATDGRIVVVRVDRRPVSRRGR